MPIAWGTVVGASHFEVLGGGGRFKGPMTTWLRYQLMDDADAANWFKTAPCTLCSATGWTVQRNTRWMD